MATLLCPLSIQGCLVVVAVQTFNKFFSTENAGCRNTGGTQAPHGYCKALPQLQAPGGDAHPAAVFRVSASVH